MDFLHRVVEIKSTIMSLSVERLRAFVIRVVQQNMDGNEADVNYEESVWRSEKKLQIIIWNKHVEPYDFKKTTDVTILTEGGMIMYS